MGENDSIRAATAKRIPRQGISGNLPGEGRGTRGLGGAWLQEVFPHQPGEALGGAKQGQGRPALPVAACSSALTAAPDLTGRTGQETLFSEGYLRSAGLPNQCLVFPATWRGEGGAVGRGPGEPTSLSSLGFLLSKTKPSLPPPASSHPEGCAQRWKRQIST